MDEEAILRELNFKAVRSGGAGGQHINKVATKVILSFDLEHSRALSESEKERLIERLGKRLTSDGILQLYSDATRSQHRNKELVTKRLLQLLKESLRIPKKRRKTGPSVKSIKRRLANKKKQAEKKDQRKKPPTDF